MARRSAIAARWEAGGSVTMGPAGRDRRVRSVPKRRQPGARDESPVQEPEQPDRACRKRPASRLQEHLTSQSSKPLPVRSYTDPRQESPERKRGRQATLSRSALWTRYSLDAILSAGPKDLLELCLDMNLLHDGRLDPCDWCGESNWRIEAKGDHASYRCKSKNCRCSKSVLSHDNDLFNKKCALRSLIGALWLFLSPINVSADQAGLILGLDHRTVRDLFSNFRAWLTPIVDRLNEELVVGSAGADTELDEISFRSKALDDQAAWRN